MLVIGVLDRGPAGDSVIRGAMGQAWWETQWLLSATAWTIAGVGALVFLWALLRDRSRGKARCPKCWYDLAGLVNPEATTAWPVTCPECGRKIEREAQSRRTCRHWKLALLALVMMLAAYPIGHIADAREFGPQRLLPLWLQAMVWPMTTGDPRAVLEMRYMNLPGFDLSSVLKASSPGWQSPFVFVVDPLEDIRDRLDDEAPSSWYHRVFVWRLVRAMLIEPGRESRVFCYSSHWKALRRGAPWRSAREVREADGALARSLLQPSLGGLMRTKEDWIRDEAGCVLELLVTGCGWAGEWPDIAATIGSSIVFVGPTDMMETLDRCDEALRWTIKDGPGSRLEVPLDSGLLAVFRHVADVTDWQDEGDEQLDALLEPLDCLTTPANAPGFKGIGAKGWDLCKSILVVVADDETQRQIDARLATWRAERATATRQAPDK